jgi:hypothetical protein
MNGVVETPINPERLLAALQGVLALVEPVETSTVVAAAV